MEPTRLFPIIAVLSLIGVESGGYALLGLITTKRGDLGPFGFRFFRAGHAHAGVLLVLSLVYFLYLPRAEYSNGIEWLAGVILVAGILGQSGGFFLHLWKGQEGASSVGTTVTRLGGALLAVALIILAVGLIKTL
jgi:heme/copper-type cytochrome/quinol oxidase subunit 4